MQKSIELFDTLTVTWKEAMSKHRQALDDGEARTSWLNLAQLTIPNNPDSMTVRSSKMPAKNQRIEIGDENLILSWSLPNEDWSDSCSALFKTDPDAPIFHSILMNQSPPEDILDLEGVLTSGTRMIRQAAQTCESQSLTKLSESDGFVVWEHFE